MKSGQTIGLNGTDGVEYQERLPLGYRKGDHPKLETDNKRISHGANGVGDWRRDQIAPNCCLRSSPKSCEQF